MLKSDIFDMLLPFQKMKTTVENRRFDQCVSVSEKCFKDWTRYVSCSGSLKKGRFGYQWQAALAQVGPIYDTSLDGHLDGLYLRNHDFSGETKN